MKAGQEHIKSKRSSYPMEPAEWQTAYYDYLYNFASYKIDDEELIKDLIQDTFLAAMQGREHFKQKSSEITWLTAILKYKIYRSYRYKEKSRLFYASSCSLSHLCSSTTEDDKTPLDLLLDPIDAKYFKKEIESFIRTLPKKWQLVYVMKYHHNESAAVICEKLQLTGNNYWVISHRLKTSLRQWYLTEWN